VEISFFEFPSRSPLDSFVRFLLSPGSSTAGGVFVFCCSLTEPGLSRGSVSVFSCCLASVPVGSRSSHRRRHFFCSLANARWIRSSGAILLFLFVDSLISDLLQGFFLCACCASHSVTVPLSIPDGAVPFGRTQTKPSVFLSPKISAAVLSFSAENLQTELTP
jgi:hypothetical protein